jgi:hypothetical protein
MSLILGSMILGVRLGELSRDKFLINDRKIKIFQRKPFHSRRLPI